MNLSYLPYPIQGFIQEIPKMLLLHQETADLATRIENMHLSAMLQHKFTLAIVGQMKSGKSTLLNALIEKDTAPVGVNECTATVNRFLFSADQERSATFRVHWENGNIDDFPLAEVSKWVGQEFNVRNTRQIDFFSNAFFLQNVNIIDTPGLRSMIEFHEAQARRVLDYSSPEARMEVLDKATVKEREFADAIIYVLNPIEKRNDERILSFFSEQTRLPGARAYNSIAVVQKWEQLWHDPDIDLIEEVQNKCNILKKQLDGKVAEVVPVSGLLARCLDWLPDTVWSYLVDLGRSPRQAIKSLTFGEQFFLEDFITDATLSVTERQELYRAVLYSVKSYLNDQSATASTWTILSFLIKLAHREECSNSKDFKKRVRELSGIDQLLNILQNRFFQRAALIKTSGILHRIWEPCEIGIARLEQIDSRRTKILAEGEKIISLLESKMQHDSNLRPVYTYIFENVGAIRDNLMSANAHKRELYSLKTKVQRFFENFNQDLTGLELLDDKGNSVNLSETELSELHALFGGNDIGIQSRLKCMEGDTPDRYYLSTLAQSRLLYWAIKGQNSFGGTEQICILAQNRLKWILDELEDV